MKSIGFAIIGIVMILFFFGGCARKVTRLQEEIKLYEAKIEENNRTSCIPGCLVFEGDSNVELIDVQEYFKTAACNYARRGSTTEDLLKRVEKVKTTKPAAIILLVGGNDLLRSFPLEIIEKNYNELIGFYKKVTGKIYFVSNLPVNPKLYSTNTAIAALNKLLRRVCNRQGATFVNIHPRLVKNDGLNPDYARDPVHLNKAGQDELIAFLKRYLDYK
jgi:lysophospholipase L1-like esterase